MTDILGINQLPTGAMWRGGAVFVRSDEYGEGPTGRAGEEEQARWEHSYLRRLASSSHSLSSVSDLIK